MNLVRVQFISIVTKVITTALGIIQSLVVISFLTKSEFGLVGLVLSIGSAIGVSQHLGIVDGAIREIAVRKGKKEIGEVFWVSQLVRQLVTIPLSLGLLFLAHWIAAGIYDRPEITPYLMIFAGVLVLQGFQDVLGAALTGLKQFRALYIIQIITAVLNVLVFSFFTWYGGITGFFWAMALMTLVMSLFMARTLKQYLTGYLQLPRLESIRVYMRELLRIGAFMYLSRIFFVLWQRLPLLVLGGVLTAEQLGDLNLSLTFGSKLTIIGMALSEVNLSWMSSLFAQERSEFVRHVQRNMERVFLFLALVTASLLFFTPEILEYVIRSQYATAAPLVLLVTSAFFIYSLLDVGTSSVFVPANDPKFRALVFFVLTGISGALTGWIVWTRPDSLLAAAALLVGAVAAFVVMEMAARIRFKVALLPRRSYFLLGIMAMCLVWLSGEPGLLWRGIAFVMLFGYVVWQGYRYGVVPKLSELFNGLTQEQVEKRKIVAFAGASWAQHSWTNRQHILTRVSSAHPVLYVEPRVWLPRHVWRMRHFPRRIKDFFMQLVWFRRERGGLFIVSQANLIPGSRRWRIVARFNHVLNRWWLLLRVKALGFSDKRRRVMWIYDTEAAEYLPDFAGATVLYDCVDDHATQAGLDRNPDLVHREEKAIFAAADIVTVTSSRLFEMKQGKARRVELVLNAGDTRLYKEKENFDSLPIELQRIAKPIMGSVGALDAYKYDFELLVAVASAHHEWNFVFIGAPVVDNASRALRELQSLPNVHMLGAVDREDVPSYVYHFNVCLIPYQANSYNEASFPLKFWEFMATGLPIVVSGLPELKPYKDLIGYAHLRDEFGVLIARALEDPGDGMARRDLAAEHSWELRATRLLELLDSVPGV